MDQAQEHYASLECTSQTFQVFYKGEWILQSNQVVQLTEHYKGKTFDPICYFPPMALANITTIKTDLSTSCPIKGKASYWSYQESENGIWSYETPKENIIKIKSHYGFDQNKGFKVVLKD